MANDESTKQILEETILSLSEQLHGEVYEQYLDGEVPEDKLQEAYALLVEWSHTSQKLLDIVS